MLELLAVVISTVSAIIAAVPIAERYYRRLRRRRHG
jgi:hypothetical protein